MNIWLLGLVAALYLYAAYDYWRDGQVGMALAFVAYALANVGFIVAVFEVAKLKGAH